MPCATTAAPAVDAGFPAGDGVHFRQLSQGQFRLDETGLVNQIIRSFPRCPQGLGPKAAQLHGKAGGLIVIGAGDGQAGVPVNRSKRLPRVNRRGNQPVEGRQVKWPGK